jgi:hypothetical protein
MAYTFFQQTVSFDTAAMVEYREAEYRDPTRRHSTNG